MGHRCLRALDPAIAAEVGGVASQKQNLNSFSEDGAAMLKFCFALASLIVIPEWHDTGQTELAVQA